MALSLRRLRGFGAAHTVWANAIMQYFEHPLSPHLFDRNTVPADIENPDGDDQIYEHNTLARRVRTTTNILEGQAFGLARHQIIRVETTRDAKNLVHFSGMPWDWRGEAEVLPGPDRFWVCAILSCWDIPFTHYDSEDDDDPDEPTA